MNRHVHFLIDNVIHKMIESNLDFYLEERIWTEKHIVEKHNIMRDYIRDFDSLSETEQKNTLIIIG